LQVTTRARSEAEAGWDSNPARRGLAPSLPGNPVRFES